MLQKIQSPALLAILCATLYGCGGGGGDDGGSSGVSTPAPATPAPATATPTPETPAPSPMLNTGVFVDSAVAGIRYRTATQQGTTNAMGEFSYLVGEAVTFSIGDIELPTVPAREFLTPLDLFDVSDVNDTSVLNLARLLQSLDEDGDADNGITITDTAHEMSTGFTLDFASETFETDVVNLVANSGAQRTALLSVTEARDHLIDTINELAEMQQGEDSTVNGCGTDHPLVGSTANFRNSGIYGISGMAEVVSNCRIVLRNFSYNGSGPAVAFYGGTNGNYNEPVGFAIGAAINGRVYNNETVVLDLPNGVTLDDFNGISVWCFRFNVNFSDARF